MFISINILFDESERLEDWNRLSSLITQKLIKLLEPTGKKISSAASSTSLEEERKIIEQLNSFQLKNSELKMSQKGDSDEPPPLESDTNNDTTNNTNNDTNNSNNNNNKVDLSELCPKFTVIPKRAAERGASPHQITLQNLDKSTLLLKLLESRFSSGIHFFYSSFYFAYCNY